MLVEILVQVHRVVWVVPVVSMPQWTQRPFNPDPIRQAMNILMSCQKMNHAPSDAMLLKILVYDWMWHRIRHLVRMMVEGQAHHRTLGG